MIRNIIDKVEKEFLPTAIDEQQIASIVSGMGLVYTSGDQAISGNKTFSNNITILGDFSVSGKTIVTEVIDVTTTGAISGNIGVFDNLRSNNIVYNTGDQTISGVKNFVFRPTVNETGVLLSGESYTKTETNTLLSNANSHVIYVDKHKQTALGIARDGSRAHPFISVRDAFAAIGNAANSAEFNDINLRYWTIKVAAGSYDETAGGDLQVPKRFFVKLDLSDGVSIIGNLVRDISGLVGSSDNPVFLIQGSSNRAFYEISGTVQRSQIGVLGNISMVNTNGINALHLFAAGVRKVEYSGTGGNGHFFTDANSTWDTLFSPSKQVTFYTYNTQNSPGFGGAGNLIGNIFIANVSDTRWIFNKSIFTTSQVFFRLGANISLPTYTERRATSFTRSGNQATVTLSENHGLSFSPSTLSDGYLPEQYIIINGVSENTSFNTPLYGAKVISYPTPNTVVYESTGADVTTPVTAANSKFIRGPFFGNANAASVTRLGSDGLFSEQAAMTFSGFANASELGQGAAYINGIAKAIAYNTPLTGWPASTILTKNTILIRDDQFQYRTTSNIGRTSSTQPVFPTVTGATVQDGFVTWICEENALNRNEVPSYNVQSKLEKLSNAKNIYLKSNISGLSSVNNVKDALEYSYLNITKNTAYNYFTNNITLGSNYINLGNSTTGITANLPVAVSGVNYIVKNLNTGIITLTGSNLIDGYTNLKLYKNESAHLLGVNNIGYTGWVTLNTNGGIS